MNKAFNRFLFETSPWPPFVSAWLVGYCVVLDGQVFLTDSGEEYLDHLASESALASNGQATAGMALA